MKGFYHKQDIVKNIGIIGSGDVGKALARGFIKYGYPVQIASRDVEKQAALKEELGNRVQVGDFAQTTSFGEILVLATKGTVALNALELCGRDNLNGKIIIDATNPIADKPPVNGVLQFTTSLDRSLMEDLQEAHPEAHFVKAFSCVGNVHMVDPDFGEIKPTMFICGDDNPAKTEVTEILDTFGWEVEDLGAVEAARVIEPLCILWCIPLFLRGESDHALKLLRKS